MNMNTTGAVEISSRLNKCVFVEILPQMRARSEIMFLDFKQIPKRIVAYKNIKGFFNDCKKKGIDPKLAENRQKFNDQFLELSKKRYLIGRYAEDRIEMLRGSSIEKEGRTLHLGIDIFSKDLEDVYSPYDGVIVRIGREPGSHSYGHYVIVKHETEGLVWYSFFGHLSKNLPKLKSVIAGEKIATLGDFVDDENGGWSRHVHYQILMNLPDEGETPIGYSTKKKLKENEDLFPDPNIVLRIPALKR